MSQNLVFQSLSNQKIFAFSQVFLLWIQHLFSTQVDLDLAHQHRIYLNSPSKKIKQTHFTFCSVSYMNTLGLILFVYFACKIICSWFWSTTAVLLRIIAKQKQTTLSPTLTYLTFPVCKGLCYFSEVWATEFHLIALLQKDSKLLFSWNTQIISKKRGFNRNQIWTT